MSRLDYSKWDHIEVGNTIQKDGRSTHVMKHKWVAPSTLYWGIDLHLVLQVSDDEDDTHPNIDTPSLFRWRHQARVEREEQHKQKKAQVKAQSMEHKKKMATITKKLAEVNVDKTVSITHDYT